MIDTGDIEKLKALRAAGVATYQRDGDKVSVAFFPEAPPPPRAMTPQEAHAAALEREERQEEFEQRTALGAARGASRSPISRAAIEGRAIAATRVVRDAVRKEKAAAG